MAYPMDNPMDNPIKSHVLASDPKKGSCEKNIKYQTIQAHQRRTTVSCWSFGTIAGT
jgi:hypothetical protein